MHACTDAHRHAHSRHARTQRTQKQPQRRIAGNTQALVIRHRSSVHCVHADTLEGTAASVGVNR
eukprot:56214-Eustigmatos_ZCMA.PRE.1